MGVPPPLFLSFPPRRACSQWGRVRGDPQRQAGQEHHQHFPWEAFLPLWTLWGSPLSLSPLLRNTPTLCPAFLPGQLRMPTFQQIHKLEVERDAVLPGEDVDSAARCRQQVQVELQAHAGPPLRPADTQPQPECSLCPGPVPTSPGPGPRVLEPLVHLVFS